MTRASTSESADYASGRTASERGPAHHNTNAVLCIVCSIEYSWVLSWKVCRIEVNIGDLNSLAWKKVCCLGHNHEN